MYDPNAGNPQQQNPNQSGFNQYPMPPVQSPYLQPVSPTPAHGAAIAGFILNIFSVICCILPIAFIPGLICSIIAFAKGNRSGISIAGLILGIIGTLLSVFMLIGYVGAMSDPSFWDSIQDGSYYSYRYGVGA